MNNKKKKETIDSAVNNNNADIKKHNDCAVAKADKENQSSNEEEEIMEMEPIDNKNGKSEDEIKPAENEEKNTENGIKPVENNEEKTEDEKVNEEKVESVLETTNNSENVQGKKKSKGLSKKTIKIIKTIVFSILAIVLGLFIFRQVQIKLNYNKWLGYFNSKKYSEAYKYYSEGEDVLKESAQNYITTLSEEAFSKYQKGEITVDEINKDVDIYNKYTIDDKDIKGANIIIIEDSRTAYSEGEEYMSSEQYLLALVKYINVDSLDVKDYSDAAAKIEKYKDKAYEEAYSIAEAAVASKDYSTVDYNNWSKIFDDTNVTNLRNLLKASLPADIQNQITNRDLDGARANIERFSLLLSVSEKQSLNAAISNEEEKIRIEGLRDNQEVYVTSTYISKKGYFNSTEIVTIVKSNTSKVTKQIDVCVLIFDSNGYPIISSISFSNSNIIWSNIKLNLSQGESGGSNSYLSLYDAGIANVKACVISVEYQDGTEWENPYYSYWIKDNQNRY